MTIRIANGAGFLGDNLDAPRLLVENAQVDYLTLEYLAELTMSILARQREKDPATGYAADFLEVLRSLLPALKAQPQLKIVTNAGGMNPQACAAAAATDSQRSWVGRHANRCRQRRRSSTSLAPTAIGWLPISKILTQSSRWRSWACRLSVPMRI